MFSDCAIRNCGPYQTLFQYHTSKQIGIKSTTWYWGHDQKAIKAWEKSCP